MVKGRKGLVDIYRALFNSQQWDLSGPDCWLLISFICPDTHTYPEVWDFGLAVGRQRKVKFVWHNYKELRLFTAQQVPSIEAFASPLLRSASSTKRNKGLVVLYFCSPQVTKMPQRQSQSLLWPHQSWKLLWPKAGTKVPPNTDVFSVVLPPEVKEGTMAGWPGILTGGKSGNVSLKVYEGIVPLTVLKVLWPWAPQELRMMVGRSPSTSLVMPSSIVPYRPQVLWL